MKVTNMKKGIVSLIIASMLISTPAMARDRDHREYEYHQQHRKKSGCGWFCKAVIGGVVVGAIASTDNRRQERDDGYYLPDNRYYPPEVRYDRRYCVREQIVEWRYGERYVYWQIRCN